MSYYILVDCNNFYVSCERLFNPSLEGKAVAVLSQNDGCIIARSQEAKQLGLKMGEPYFKVKDYCERVKVVVFSSNYRLYGDLSERVMSTLSLFAPEIEVYSIDEAFIKFPETISPERLFEQCVEIKQTVRKWVGIPISIGMAPTKTLAKLANHLAKKDRKVGLFTLCDPQERAKILETFPIEDVWGIGGALSQRLRCRGVFTVGDFINLNPQNVRKIMGVVGERMFWELKGVEALTLLKEAPKKNITFTRSFGKTITEIEDLSEAVSTFVSKACIKLRKQRSYASAIQVYLETDFYENGQLQKRYHGMLASFLAPTNDTAQVISAAKCCVAQLYSKHEKYRKAGIFLLDLISEENLVPDLFFNNVSPQRELLMHTIDSLNDRFGKNTVFFGATGVNQKWQSRSEYRTEHNTTDWAHLPVVYARR